MSPEDDMLWKIREFIYAQFAETARPPAVETTAHQFHITPDEAASIYHQLQDRHALFLEPGTHQIGMAFPFSGLPSDFKVDIDGKIYWANCAWDMLGIPAALHSRAASIDAVCAESREPIHLEIQDGRLRDTATMIHIAVPFARWYEDLRYT